VQMVPFLRRVRSETPVAVFFQSRVMFQFQHGGHGEGSVVGVVVFVTFCLCEECRNRLIGGFTKLASVHHHHLSMDVVCTPI